MLPMSFSLQEYMPLNLLQSCIPISRNDRSREQPIRKNEKSGASLSLTPNDDDDGDWPEEEDDAHDWTPMFTGNEDDVSFSDLEGYDK
uniref:Uncharacterized protein n=1 Tax=Brassica oleracea TaxID=3712 RepID=A0A3P6DPV3_BRAOL|nr:unnamed protein product [Brassica oleracea]